MTAIEVELETVLILLAGATLYMYYDSGRCSKFPNLGMTLGHRQKLPDKSDTN